MCGVLILLGLILIDLGATRGPALLQWVEDRKTVKAHAIATSKVPSELTIEVIAQEITLRIQKAYDTGFRDGKKAGKAEIMDAIKGVK